MESRAAYLRRVLSVYLFPHKGPLSFWYETPELHPGAFAGDPRPYYMRFQGKAGYRGPFDGRGVPLLDYRGTIGRQYNPIAVAQYGLACWNAFLDGADARAHERFLRAADWLVDHLEPNAHGVEVWHHHFDWPYREPLKAPWYSGLAQGQGLSLLVRAERVTGKGMYGDAAVRAFASLTRDVSEGGVIIRGRDGSLWIEEYLVEPPSHILNGFLWALWGVHDFARWSGRQDAEKVFDDAVNTLAGHLHRYDTGDWSLYELSDAPPPMLASPYYHRLHVVQLEVLHRLTGLDVFLNFAGRWRRYRESPLLRSRAFARKAWFKLRHY